MTVLVTGSLSRRELTEIADKQVRRAIQTVDGVGSVDLNGGQAREIRVLLNAQRLTSHNFTVLDVRDALRRENIEAPGGRMITGPQELGLRTLGRVTSAEQFGEIVIGTRGGAPVRVRDVAQSKTAPPNSAPGPPFSAKTFHPKTLSPCRFSGNPEPIPCASPTMFASNSNT